jgi:hypothetical protein
MVVGFIQDSTPSCVSFHGSHITALSNVLSHVPYTWRYPRRHSQRSGMRTRHYTSRIGIQNKGSTAQQNTCTVLFGAKTFLAQLFWHIPCRTLHHAGACGFCPRCLGTVYLADYACPAGPMLAGEPGVQHVHTHIHTAETTGGEGQQDGRLALLQKLRGCNCSMQGGQQDSRLQYSSVGTPASQAPHHKHYSNAVYAPISSSSQPKRTSTHRCSCPGRATCQRQQKVHAHEPRKMC